MTTDKGAALLIFPLVSVGGNRQIRSIRYSDCAYRMRQDRLIGRDGLHETTAKTIVKGGRCRRRMSDGDEDLYSLCAKKTWLCLA